MFCSSPSGKHSRNYNSWQIIGRRQHLIVRLPVHYERAFSCDLLMPCILYDTSQTTTRPNQQHPHCRCAQHVSVVLITINFASLSPRYMHVFVSYSASCIWRFCLPWTSDYLHVIIIFVYDGSSWSQVRANNYSEYRDYFVLYLNYVDEQ